MDRLVADLSRGQREVLESLFLQGPLREWLVLVEVVVEVVEVLEDQVSEVQRVVLFEQDERS